MFILFLYKGHSITEGGHMKNQKIFIIAIFALIILSFGCYRFIKHVKNQSQQVQETNSEFSEETDVLPGENIEWQSNEYNYLAIGNSITWHGIENIWWNEIGMAASDEEHDYFHLVLKYLEENNDFVKGVPYNFCEWETTSHDRAETLEYLDHYLDPELNLVTIQLGENVQLGEDENNLKSFQEDYALLINHVKEKAPNARILVIDDFWSDGLRNARKKNAAEETGVEFVSLEGITNNRDYYCGLNTIVYDKNGGEHIVDNDAVANHPGDKGMEAIASRIIEVLKDKKK